MVKTNIVKKAVIVIPTYNESYNIRKLTPQIFLYANLIEGVDVSVVVADDHSPDKTGDTVRELGEKYPVYLSEGPKEGFGKAVMRGYRYAIDELQADYVMQMDADLSHDPCEIPHLLQRLLIDSDFVQGSRYVEGGSLPEDWSWLRRLNSKAGNTMARWLLRLHAVHDCTGGYRAMKRQVLEAIDFENLPVHGYVFQVSSLYKVKQAGFKINEVPIQFAERTAGKSKLRIKDVLEFINYVLWESVFGFAVQVAQILGIALLLAVAAFLVYEVYINAPFGYGFGASLIFVVSLLMTIQGAFTIFWMLYAWEDPTNVARTKSPYFYERPSRSFTAIIPAKDEEAVIGDTIRAVHAVAYPARLKETIIVCHANDTRTIEKAEKTIKDINSRTIRLVTYDGDIINKPHALNVGLAKATKNTVIVFDAEDEPHENIYHIINTVMVKDGADVVQSGVQLMNFRSRWFSMLNVLEYFFWFKSALHFFVRTGLMPLGGNTVAFRRRWLEKANGWDEDCLTEDADMGIRMSLLGAKLRVVYDEKHVTREETPAGTREFLRQRTRWNQGFLQILLKGDWTRFPSLRQKLLSLYILVWPEVQAVLLFYVPFSILMMMIRLKLPVWVTMLATLPLYFLVIQFVTYAVGLYEFTRNYKYKYPIFAPLYILATFVPYQIMLGVAALRATMRLVSQENSWDKTMHVNAHRAPHVNFMQSRAL